ncbi:MAG: hypothetical protein GY712_12045 [Oceanicoccus sp.]|uniref:DUF6868 family protein n=1 Tax=Oceanicoccus sp. TaxID=2691044 RepID=UPI00262F4F4F|nr:hypothetical protein [Oceanicoccus sp.]MCP3908734.1 hypothetical protein [Oceanicoccus sp.]MDG1772173.1 hypothetical protein [Oceanicoccus sp.]
MNSELLIGFFGWGAVINYLLLLLWFLFFSIARDTVFKIHSTWFKLSEDGFDTIHYCGLGIFKLLVFVFFLTPYLVLRFFA